VYPQRRPKREHRQCDAQRFVVAGRIRLCETLLQLALNEASGFEPDYALAESDAFDAVRDHNYGRTRKERRQMADYLAFARHIERIHRLVEYQKTRLKQFPARSVGD
jgi:hypothetical protein